MKSILSTAMLAAGLALFATTGAQAATTTTANIGDLFLGFHAATGTGSDKDYLVDLGQITNFESATGSISLSIGNIAADLASVFGSDFATRSDLQVGIIGSNTQPGTTVGPDPAATLFITTATGSGIVPIRKSTNTQTVTSNKIASMSTAYNGKTSTDNSPVGLIQNNTDSNSYSSFQLPLGSPSTNSFGLGYSNESNFGTTPVSLDFYRSLPGAGNPPATLIGAFTIDSSANVTYTPVGAAVPEPGTAWAILPLMGMVGFARRRTVKA